MPSKKSASANQSPQEIALGIWEGYLERTPQRTKLIDVFMGFLVVVGVLQFGYCVIAGNYVRATDLLVYRVGSMLTFGTALQCFPIRVFGDGWSVCFDW